MALHLQECDAIIEAARQNSVFLQLGFMRRSDPEFAAAASRIEAGEIGQPMMIKSLIARAANWGKVLPLSIYPRSLVQICVW